MTNPKQNEIIEVADPHSVVMAAPNDAGSILAVISRAATDPAVDVEKVERLAALYERMQAKQAEQSFGVAMAEAQKGMDHVRTDANNPSTKSKYASYGALDKAVRPVYTKHGFALTFGTADGAPEGHVRVICDVFHKAGHTKRYHIDMPADGKGAKGGDVMTKTHAMGSALTYGFRYLLKAIFNIVVSDDDGNGAGGDAPLTEDQMEHVQRLIEQTKSDPEKVCAFMKVESLSVIPQSQYRKIIEALNTQPSGKAK